MREIWPESVQLPHHIEPNQLREGEANAYLHMRADEAFLELSVHQGPLVFDRKTRAWRIKTPLVFNDGTSVVRVLYRRPSTPLEWLRVRLRF